MLKHRHLHIYKKTLLFLLFSAMLFFSACTKTSVQDYGVFTGINGNEAAALSDYRIVVIEPSEFEKEQIDELHKNGKTVYGYLNIGSLESYRPYYKDFKNITLSSYPNWPDEQWIDVSDSRWQNFIVNTLAQKYYDMGFDGFFIDNTDIYYHYNTEKIFNGLCTILQGLRSYDVTLVINGGDTFVSKCINQNIGDALFDGVNQENVFTHIDFEKTEYRRQSAEETEYYKKYLSKVREYGLKVFLLEYCADTALADEIELYCKENGFLWYNAGGLELDE